uniref:Uncharacterized protein n=1 Tax=viral metagenome TaxID=1070528 RepID=A0A6H1ZHZ0_9ZZZZ
MPVTNLIEIMLMGVILIGLFDLSTPEEVRAGIAGDIAFGWGGVPEDSVGRVEELVEDGVDPGAESEEGHGVTVV